MPKCAWAFRGLFEHSVYAHVSGNVTDVCSRQPAANLIDSVIKQVFVVFHVFYSRQPAPNVEGR
jgi:hypothetical protein